MFCAETGAANSVLPIRTATPVARVASEQGLARKGTAKEAGLSYQNRKENGKALERNKD